MTYLVTILFLVAYGLGLFFWDKNINWRLNLTVSRTIKLLHYTGLLISLIVGITYANYDIGLRGLWTTRTIIIFTLLTGVFFIFLADKASLSKIEGWYFKIFAFVPIFTAATLFIPFLGVVLVLSLIGQLTDPATQIYYEDDKLRVQSSFVGVLGPPKLDVFEKKMVFDKKINHTDISSYEIDSVKVAYDTDSTRILVYGLSDYDAERKGKPKTICLKRLK